MLTEVDCEGKYEDNVFSLGSPVVVMLRCSSGLRAYQVQGGSDLSNGSVVVVKYAAVASMTPPLLRSIAITDLERTQARGISSVYPYHETKNGADFCASAILHSKVDGRASTRRNNRKFVRFA